MTVKVKSKYCCSGFCASVLLHCVWLCRDSSGYILSPSYSICCLHDRRLLFKEGNLIDHMAGVGDAAFSRPWQKSTRADETECKASLFIEPMKWMEFLELQEMMGKVSRPYCYTSINTTL